MICLASDDCHDPGTCDPGVGTCGSGPAKPDGSACNDGNNCTQGDSCQSGSFHSGPPTDLDGDAHPDVFCGGNDCQDTNPTVWNPPFEVANFRPNNPQISDFAWDSQDVQAGPATKFQVSSGNFAQNGFSLAAGSCLEDSVSANAYTDARPSPVLDNGYWYLVRATNNCGVGTLGTTQRDNLVAPCP